MKPVASRLCQRTRPATLLTLVAPSMFPRKRMFSIATAASTTKTEKAQTYFPSAATCPLVPKDHLKVPLPDECQILQLRDGRLMSYAEYGSKDPHAHPFVFCHGIPDSRIDACLLESDQQLAEKLNIRWIAIDRPGIGLSSLHEGRNTLDWVHDLQQLINHLQLPSYHIFSVSGGTGYALAAAMYLPREQVKGVGIVVGVAPWEAGTKGMSLANRVGYVVWKYYPAFFQWIFDKWVVPSMQEEKPAKAEKIVRKQAKYFSGEDRKEMEQPEMIRGIAKLDREVFRQGSRGAVEDSIVQTSPWGFEIEDVKYSGIRLWYGAEDVNTPPAMGKYLATRLPNAIYKEYESKSHFTMWHHIEEILTDMLTDSQDI